ncbi:MAG TPA: GNAT family N-acetyltransferase [Solirubrobacteraceae bacterium]
MRRTAHARPPTAKVVLPAEPIVEGPTALRPWRESDIPALVAACQDREIGRWTSVPYGYGEPDARAFMLARFDAVLAATAAPFAIVSAANPDELLGSVSLMRLLWRHARGEVGYWLARPARGRGHATRAVLAVCRWGFDTLGLERIDLLASVENIPSQRVTERCGFTRDAVLRSYLRGKEGRQDMVAFGLLRGEVQ